MTQSDKNSFVFVGTYTQTESEGIYTCRFDSDSGALEPVSVATGAGNPSFLALHPNKQFIYAASEVEQFDGKSQGAVYAYSVNPESGELTYVNRQGTGGTRTVSCESGRDGPYCSCSQLSRRKRVYAASQQRRQSRARL